MAKCYTVQRCVRAQVYDLVGNILSIQKADCTPESGIKNNPDGKDKLDRIFNYDPLYSYRKRIQL